MKRVELPSEEDVVEMTMGQKERLIVIEDVKIKQELSEKQVVAPSQASKAIEDDWFVLLDASIREPSFIPSGTNKFTIDICHLKQLNAYFVLQY